MFLSGSFCSQCDQLAIRTAAVEHTADIAVYSVELYRCNGLTLLKGELILRF
jgi:hypothetical protein